MSDTLTWETVYWENMPVHYMDGPGFFSRQEIEEAIEYAKGFWPEVTDGAPEGSYMKVFRSKENGLKICGVSWGGIRFRVTSDGNATGLMKGTGRKIKEELEAGGL
jgi:hypothetical protein